MGNQFDGAMVARDGVTVMDESGAEEFGEEWQVLDSEPMLFATPHSSQFPAQCNPPPISSSAHRNLRETQDPKEVRAAE
jgi:hypothetical protein